MAVYFIDRPDAGDVIAGATFGADLIEGMKLVLAHQRDKVELWITNS